MTRDQLKNYEAAAAKIEQVCGFGDGEIDGHEVNFEVGKGTWYIPNHGYLDDLAANDELPNFLSANVEVVAPATGSASPTQSKGFYSRFNLRLAACSGLSTHALFGYSFVCSCYGFTAETLWM